MNAVSLLLLVAVGLSITYLYLLAVAARRTCPIVLRHQPQSRFAIAIPAHDEETVIGDTVTALRQLEYPSCMFDIHVVADHCTDRTAQVARAAGAIVHERLTESRSSKGAALRWLFERVLNAKAQAPYDAVVIFDADTRVDSQFLRVMDARLANGDQVIQGQHRISNPDDGWFPALAWAMFIVDNRFQNLGRSNLGWSAKHMGDSICFRTDVLRLLGWEEGLTEDYAFRQRLLLEGVKIRYEPAAIGYGQAPLTWQAARSQRARWLRGTRDASRRFARKLLVKGIQCRDMAMVDGAIQAFLPSYSTMTLISALVAVVQLLVNWRLGPVFAWPLVATWIGCVGMLFIYPFIGLLQEKAPLKAYLAILSGPLFILWRTWLALTVRYSNRPVVWIRTAHERKTDV